MDKVLHLIVGMALAANPLLEPTPALATSIAAGVLKEMYDRKHRARHTPDARDAASTILGGAIVFAVRMDF